MGAVTGDVGTVFVCYKPGEEGMYIVTDDHNYRALTESDIQDPEIAAQVQKKNTLSTWQSFALQGGVSTIKAPDKSGSTSDPEGTGDPDGSTSGSKTDAVKDFLGKNGNYATKEQMNEMATKGTFKGKKVSPDVQAGAKELMANDGKKFNELAGDDGIIAPWDFKGTSSPDGNNDPDGQNGGSKTDAVKSFLEENGGYATKEQMNEMATKGTFKGKKVSADVQAGAKELMADDGKKFTELAGDDDIIAPWDFDGSKGPDDPNGSSDPNAPDYSDLNSYMGSHTGTGTGGYYTKGDLQAIASGNFKGDSNIPDNVKQQARTMLNNNDFDKLAGDDGLMGSQDIPAPAPSGTNNSGSGNNYGQVSTYMTQHTGSGAGGYYTRKDLQAIADNNFNGDQNITQSVRDQAKAMLESGDFDKFAGDDGLMSVDNVGQVDPSSNFTVDPKNFDWQTLKKLYPDASDPGMELSMDLKRRSGAVGKEYITREDVATAIGNAENDNQKAAFQWVFDHFDEIDKSNGENDGKIGGKDIRIAMGGSWRPTQNMGGEVDADTFRAVYGNDPTNTAVNEIKTLSNSGSLWLHREDVSRAITAETDEQKKKVLEWIYNHFDAIDGVQGGNHGKDGIIGAADIQKYFGVATDNY